MQRIVGAVAFWTLFVAGLVLFFPLRTPIVPCARPVGTPESHAACQPILDAANDQIFRFETLPMLVAIAAGYLVIVALEVRRRRSPEV